MAKPVTAVEIDWLNQGIREARAGDVSMGVLVRRRLVEIAGDHSRWQYVVQGGTQRYRQWMTEWLCDSGKETRARAFALCGRGDQLGVEMGGTQVRIRPKGCGCRYCPRCSRGRGRKFLRRVTEMLRTRPHEQMWHIVFTQRAEVGEDLSETRARFELAWKIASRAMKRCGLVGGLVTYHLVRTMTGAWHWHAHLIAEVAGGWEAKQLHEKFDGIWRKAKGEAAKDDQPLFMRLLSEPGPALTALEETAQMDFWKESSDPIATVLQYAVRDVLQGVERWVQNVGTKEDAIAFGVSVAAAKMHRLIGSWRKSVAKSGEGVEAPERAPVGTENSAGGKTTTKVFQWLGSVDQVIQMAMQGVEGAQEGLRLLMGCISNRTTLAERLYQVLRGPRC